MKNQTEINNKIRESVPSAETIEEAFEGDEGIIQLICNQFNSKRDELIFTRKEALTFTKSTESNVPIRIQVMDFSDFTSEEVQYEL